MKSIIIQWSTIAATTAALLAAQPADHLVFQGGEGAGKGKHIVLIAGDEEYRSEEAMPMLGQLLSEKHGFKCTVLFSLDGKGTVEPKAQGNLSNSQSIDSADLILMSIRFRNWDDTSMERFHKAYLRGTPMVTLRTSNHGFNFPATSKWAKYSFNAKEDTGWKGGFGMHTFGMTWIAHHGKHKHEGCRTVVEEANKANEILNSVGTIFAESDVYTARPPASVNILLRGIVTETLKPDSKAVAGKKNNPTQPVAWTVMHKNDDGKTNKIFNTTMGAASDLDDANLRRLVVNACYWGLGLKVPTKANVDVPASFQPSFYGFNTAKKDKLPAYYIPTTAKNTNVSTATKGSNPNEKLELKDSSNVVILGGGLASRMMKYNHFETELQLRYPDKKLTIRNIADEGDTPSFRPHPGRSNQFAFPGAEDLYKENNGGAGAGHFETPDKWITRLKADTIIAFFGHSSSFRGETGLELYKKELGMFIDHTLSNKYNGKTAPQLVIVSPTAIQNLSATHHTPTGEIQNKNLALYTAAMQEVCASKGILFIDVFTPSKTLFNNTKEALTIDGALLTSKGYEWFAGQLANDIFGKAAPNTQHKKSVYAAVAEKNWVWHNLYKIPNGVHVYGRRFTPYGPGNYPFELTKLTEMAAVRDQAIWQANKGQTYDLAKADAATSKLPEVKTNYQPSVKNGNTDYLTGKQTIEKLNIPENYKIELFADEKMFPDLANPVQMSFDNKGRLWVACMPSYPHWKPGDPRPQDKILIFEDTNNDGKADKQTVFYDKLHLTIGFELSAEGVYVSQADSLILLTDTNGDDKADVKEYLLSGFDDHDTHHAISAFTTDPSGAIYMGEGVFLRSNVENVYGTHRGANGGFFRYNPKRRHLELTAQLKIPNPWGTAFDKWGQNFFLNTSGTKLEWMMPGTVKARYAHQMIASRDLISTNKVRPTSGLEVVSSSHFPDEVQGDILLCNNIGFLGIKQHNKEENSTGYKLTYRQDLIRSDEGNFRPVDLEFAPDGSLYVIDWSNVLIGHMQHSARDPQRDHVHGRIYRITYPSRPLVKAPKIAGASIGQLLDNLKLHEDRARYRTRRELRGRDTDQVLTATKKWVAGLDKNATGYEHQLLEALWVTWGHNKIDQDLLNQLLVSNDHKVRSAAVRAVRYNVHQITNHVDLMKKAATDKHGRVRLEAITAASWLADADALSILAIAKELPVDDWIKGSLQMADTTITGIKAPKPKNKSTAPKWLKGRAAGFYNSGKKIYHRDAHCATCHQADGKGLPAAGFPPIANTKWVNEDPERLIKITLKGLMGPIEVNGKKFNGAMTPFEGLLSDREVAEVLTYVKNSFGNKSGIISPVTVSEVRAAMKKQVGLLNAEELLKEHPHK